MSHISRNRNMKSVSKTLQTSQTKPRQASKMPFPYADSEPQYLIQTERLGITHADPKSEFDCEAHMEVPRQPSFAKRVPNAIIDRKSTREFLEVRWKQVETFGYYGNYVIWLKEPTVEASQIPRVVGVVHMVRKGEAQYPDVGFTLYDDFQGHGYATEAASALIKYIQANYKEPIVLGFTDAANTKSRAVLERVGLQLGKISKFTEGDNSHEVATYAIGDGWEKIDFDKVAEERIRSRHQFRESKGEDAASGKRAS